MRDTSQWKIYDLTVCGEPDFTIFDEGIAWIAENDYGIIASFKNREEAEKFIADASSGSS